MNLDFTIKVSYGTVRFFGLLIGSICLLLGSELGMSTNRLLSQEETSVVTNDGYIAEIQQWQAANEARFKDPFGWLALTGNFWLQDGENPIGSGDASVVKLPEDIVDVPTGSFVVRGGSVELRLDSKSIIEVNGKSEGTIPLTIDASRIESDGKDLIRLGDRVRLQLVRRNGRYAVRVRDRQNPAFAEFPGKRWHKVQSEFRVEAEFTPYEPTRTISIVNVKGDKVDTEVVGSLSFQIRGRVFQLDAFSESPESLFLVFKDLTSGKSTYPPGRFLTTAAPKDGKVLLDFNKAYNPPCAFSPHALCPLPPKQNYLNIEIFAGERKGD